MKKEIGISVLVLLLAIGVVVPLTTTTTLSQAAYGQQQPQQQQQQPPSSSVAAATAVFENIEDGIRFNVPEGWVVDYVGEGARNPSGSLVLAHICQEQNALPEIGGEFDCTSSLEQVAIHKDPFLNKKPDIAKAYQGRGISEIKVDDYIAYTIAAIENFFLSENYATGPSVNPQIVSSEEKPVRIAFTDSANNNTTTTPGKIVDVAYTVSRFEPPVHNKMLMTIINEGGQSITGFKVMHIFQDESIIPGTVLQAVQEIFDSFEILAPSPSSSSPPPTPPPSPPTAAPTPAPAPSPLTGSQTLNVTELRSLVAQGQEQFDSLSTVIVQSNSTSDNRETILSHLNSIQLTFQNIRENLNGIAAGTQIIQ